MARKPDKSQRMAAEADRKKRLKDALKSNIQKRKQQANARKCDDKTKG